MAGEVKLPHDVSGLLAFRGIIWEWIVGALLGLILLSAIVWFFIWWSKRPRKNNPDSTPKINPIDRIHAELCGLNPQLPFNATSQRDFYFRLSLLLREFIEARFEVFATDRTYQELVQPLQEHLKEWPNVCYDILHFLQRSDLVKYADKEVGQEDALRDRDQVVEWVKELRVSVKRVSEVLV